LAVSLDIKGRSDTELRSIFNISNDLDDPKEKRKIREESEWAFLVKQQSEQKASMQQSTSSEENSDQQFDV
jgi:hypothetical protein